jgi:hypothetical protein
MNARRRFTTLIVACLMLAPVLCGLAACGGEPAYVDPQTVLSAASAKMKVIKGFHFAYEVHQPESAAPKDGIVSIAGDISSNGNMQATVRLLGGGVLFDVDFVALGATHYVLYPLSPEWKAIPAAESPVGTLNLAAGTIRVLDNITGIAYVGTEKKGGAKTYHITGTVAAADVEAIAGSVDTTNPFPTDIWIGIDDSFVHEVDIAGAAQPSEDAKVWRSIALSNLDTPVDIKAPQ